MYNVGEAPIMKDCHHQWWSYQKKKLEYKHTAIAFCSFCTSAQSCKKIKTTVISEVAININMDTAIV